MGSDLVDSITLASSGAAATADVAGSDYDIVPSTAVISETLGTGMLNKYYVTYVDGLLTVTALGITGNITANNKVYDATDAATIATRTLSGVLGSDTVIYTGGTATFSDENVANGKTVTGSGLSLSGADAANYTVNTTAATTADITAKAVTIDGSRAYDGTKDVDAIIFTISGLIPTETLGLTGSGTVPSANVGNDYVVTLGTLDLADGTGSASNYNLASGTADITAKALTIIADNQNKTYGDTFTFDGDEFTSVGLQNSETIGSVTLNSTGAVATATVAGSTYAVTSSAATGGTFDIANYTPSYVNGVLTVNKAALTITADGQSKTYGDTFTFDGDEFGTAGLVNSDTVTSATIISAGAAATATVAGSTYAITPDTAVGTGLGNYSITYTPGLFTVSPKALTITADDATKVAGDTLIFAGTELTNSALIAGDSVNSVILTSLGAPAIAFPGTYAILASNASGSGISNYDITYDDGILTVNTSLNADLLNAGLNNRYRWPIQEILNLFRIYPMDASGAGSVYFYHPIVSADSSAFEGFQLSEEMYEFIEGQLKLKEGDFFSWLEEELK